MKIKHLKRYFIGILVIALLGFLAGNAFGAGAAHDNESRDFTDGDAATGNQGKWENNFIYFR